MENKIDLSKVQHILDWAKTQLYLDTKAEKAKKKKNTKSSKN